MIHSDLITLVERCPSKSSVVVVGNVLVAKQVLAVVVSVDDVVVVWMLSLAAAAEALTVVLG